MKRSTLARSAAVASITVALLLVTLKTWASWRTGSTAMLGSLADSALDLVASLATLVGVWFAAQPADREHRFGHRKAEALAAMVQVVLIAISATAMGFASPCKARSTTAITAQRPFVLNRTLTSFCSTGPINSPRS